MKEQEDRLKVLLVLTTIDAKMFECFEFNDKNVLTPQAPFLISRSATLGSKRQYRYMLLRDTRLQL